MPVNAFNGPHGWGYDGVLWSAVHEPYGGPAAYQRFVDACHAAGLGVIQDVVHNHLGPSGNYLPMFGPYLVDGDTPWGDQVNLDRDGSAEVRRLVLDSVRGWFTDFHVDGLRLDAVHALVDESETHLLEEMATEVAALAAYVGRPLFLIAESDLNDPHLVTPREGGGLGLDAQWSDDFHHALHVALTGETDGYYADFEPLGALAKVLRARLLPRRHLVVLPRPRPRRPARRRRGSPAGGSSWPTRTTTRSATAPAATGWPRRSTTTSSPWRHCSRSRRRSRRCCSWARSGARSTPFAFFTSHPEPDLGRAVSEGRLGEFAQMAGTPRPSPTRRTRRPSSPRGWTGPSGSRRAAGRCWTATAAWPTSAAPCRRSPTPTCARSR